MTDKTLFAATAILLAFTSAAVAQNTPASQPLPGLDDFSLPSSRPTPRRAPEPEPTVRPSASTTPRAVVPPTAVPAVRATPAPRATPPARSAMPAPTARAAPVVVPTPQPVPPQPLPPITPLATPTPEASTPPAAIPTPVAASPQPATPTPIQEAASAALPLWVWLMLACVVLAIGALSFGWWWPRLMRRRDEERGRDYADRRDGRDREIFVLTDVEPPLLSASPARPDPAPLIVLPAPWLTGDRATLDLELIPNRAGTDPDGLIVEYLIVVRNTGKADATGIRLDVRLLGAGPRQDELITALFALPIDKPIVPPFDLRVGKTVEFGGSATHPRDTLEIMPFAGSGAGRNMVVPVLAVNVRYGWSDGTPGAHGQTAHSYVVGIARGAEAKLQPFPLDGAPRMHENVSALDYTVTVVS